MTGINDTWPVTTSPVPGHYYHPTWGEADARLAADREAVSEAPAGMAAPAGAGDIDIDELIAAIRRPLVDPPPIRDPALEDT